MKLQETNIAKREYIVYAPTVIAKEARTTSFEQLNSKKIQLQ